MEKHHVRFNLLSPGIQYEIGLFRNLTASTSFGLGLATPTGQYSLAPVYNAKAKFTIVLKGDKSGLEALQVIRPTFLRSPSITILPNGKLQAISMR